MATGSYIAGKSRHRLSDKSEREDSEKDKGAICRRHKITAEPEGGECGSRENGKVANHEADKENNRVNKPRETKITSAGSGVSEIEVREVSKRIGYEDVSEISQVSRWEFGR